MCSPDKGRILPGWQKWEGISIVYILQTAERDRFLVLYTRSNCTFWHSQPIGGVLALSAFQSEFLPVVGIWREYMWILEEQWKQFQNFCQALWSLPAFTGKGSVLFFVLWWGQFSELVFLVCMMLMCRSTDKEGSLPLWGICTDIDSELGL